MPLIVERMINVPRTADFTLDLNLHNSLSVTALIYAAEFECAECVNALVTKESLDLDAYQKDHQTALFFAAKHDNKDIAHSLI